MEDIVLGIQDKIEETIKLEKKFKHEIKQIFHSVTKFHGNKFLQSFLKSLDFQYDSE